MGQRRTELVYVQLQTPNMYEARVTWLNFGIEKCFLVGFTW